MQFIHTADRVSDRTAPRLPFPSPPSLHATPVTSRLLSSRVFFGRVASGEPSLIKFSFFGLSSLLPRHTMPHAKPHQEGVELHEQQEEARRKARDDEFQQRKRTASVSASSSASQLQQQQQQQVVSTPQSTAATPGSSSPAVPQMAAASSSSSPSQLQQQQQQQSERSLAQQGGAGTFEGGSRMDSNVRGVGMDPGGAPPPPPPAEVRHEEWEGKRSV